MREIRTITADDLRVEKRADGKTVIKGYAARFNMYSETLYGYFREKIEPGAFANAIKTDDVRALFNHEAGIVLGRTPRTLELREDDKGLWMEAEPPDTQAARDVLVLIDRRDVTGQSFSFDLDYEDEGAETWDYADGMVTRTIKKISRLWDVGPVTYPAYPDTDVAIAQRMLIPDGVRAIAERIKKEGLPVARDFARLGAERARALDLHALDS